MADTLSNGEGASKRAEKTIRLFLNAEGVASPRARLDSVAFEVTLIEAGEKIGLRWDELSSEVQRAAGLYGIMTSVTNAVGAKNLSASDMVDNATARLEVIRSGAWSAESKVGARTGDVLEAIIRAFAESGKPLDEAGIETRRKLLLDEDQGPAFRDKALANPRVAAIFAAIKAQRAEERLAKAKAKAADSTGDLDL
jgi:hypothetical protein